MLKLVKYEITQFYQRYLLIYGIFLMICLCSNYFPELFVNDDILYVRIAMFSMLAVFLVNTVINFNQSMYKSSGYLTLTLPLSTKKIVGAKLLGSLCWFLISMIVLWRRQLFHY